MDEFKKQYIKNFMGNLYKKFLETVYVEDELPDVIKDIFKEMDETGICYGKILAQIYFLEYVKLKITEPKIRKKLVQMLEDLDKQLATFEI